MSNIKSKLQYFPINIYAIVMGLGGTTLAFYNINHNPILHWILATLTTIIFIIITFLYSLKIFYFRAEVIKELNHPIKLSFFSAFSISLLLISSIYLQYSNLATFLWLLGSTIQLFFTLYVLNTLINKRYTINEVTPSWFIPVAGPLIVPISGTQLGFSFLSAIAFPIGFIFWIILFTIILYRLIFHDPLPTKLIPMLCIMLAPPSIASISLLFLVNNGIGPLMLYGIALFIGALLLLNLTSFIKAPFFLSAWAYSFPFAAFCLASSKILPIYIQFDVAAIILDLLLLCLSLLIVYLSIRTLILIKNGKICTPE